MRRFVVLDSFRGIFSVLVILFHLRLNTFISDNSFTRNCDLFVDFFFVLSGFVIAAAYVNRLNSVNDGLSFLKKRFWRLYPLYIYTLLVYVVFETGKYYLNHLGILHNAAFTTNNITGLINHIFLLNSTPLIQNSLSWNYPGWSMSAEVIAYIVFAISLIVFKKNRPVLFVVLVIVYLGVFFVRFGDLNIKHTYDFGFLRGLLSFAIGNITFYVFSNTPFKFPGKIVATIAEVSIILVIIIAVINYRTLSPVSFIYAILFSICILIFSAEQGSISHFLTKRIFQILGKYSYSIYLNQAIVIAVTENFFVKAGTPTTVLLILPFVDIVIIVLYSHFTFKYIESRFYKIKHEVALPKLPVQN
jgi:peptidoglycan/LPS O-acetylase OafA/YrhL